MFFERFWKKNKDKVRKSNFEKGSYLHLRAGVNSESRFKKIFKLVPSRGLNFSKFRRIFNRKLLLLLIIIAILSTFSHIALNTNTFKITKVEIETNVSISESMEIESRFLNGNIFKTSNSDVFKFLKERNPRVESVLLRKVYPGTIQIVVEVDIPRHLVVNFTGGALLNEEFKVLDKFDAETVLILLQHEKDLLADIGNEESIFVAEEFRKGLSEEEKKEFDWNKISIEEKKKTFEKIKTDLQLKVDKHFTDLHKKLKAEIPEYGRLQLVDFYDEKPLETSKLIQSQLEISNRVESVIKRNNQEIAYQRWVSRLNLEVKTDKNITLNFSTANVLVDVDTQFRSLDALISEGKFKENRHFDLRTKNFAAE